MGILRKLKRAMRGGISPSVVAREALRRRRVARRQAIERPHLNAINEMPARLSPEFAALAPSELLEHFKRRDQPVSWVDQLRVLDGDRGELIATADQIVNASQWELAGLGLLTFAGEDVWRRDPLSDAVWGLEYHADVEGYRTGGPDIRVLWELNRFGHAITFARAYAMTSDVRYAETFFLHVESWIEQNPYGRGANWNCAMEVALRAINLLAAFDLFRKSAPCTEALLLLMLKFFDQHGRFIRDNNEFSYLATSNHYLSDVIGLFWIGTLLPELESAAHWREFGLSETLREMDKQILPDGSDFEASTGYHKFVAEMFLFTFMLARNNGTEVPRKYWNKLRSMLEYVRTILRPDGRGPLIGDADGSQIVPVVKRDADDMAYLLELGAVVFDEPKLSERSAGSAAFPDAGAYILRDGDLFLHFNANDSGIHGRGSHGHNDALSIEVSALGRPFIVDPGSYVYNFDRDARHEFRSTAYHSTVMIDGVEQNTMSADLPFILGNEAKPRVLDWETSPERDIVVAEHYGYRRLASPVTHRRRVAFEKQQRFWRVTDNFAGTGTHMFDLSFHIGPGLTVDSIDPVTVSLRDDVGRRLLIRLNGSSTAPSVIAAFRSTNYGHKEPTQILRWTQKTEARFDATFYLVPVAPNETIEARLALVGELTQNSAN